jgi:hypothetical protein
MKKTKDNPVPSLDFNIIKTNTFKEDDEICHIRNFMVGLPYFFKATDYDVKHYSGKNGIYLLKQYGVETNNEKPKSGHMTEISWGSKKHPDED